VSQNLTIGWIQFREPDSEPLIASPPVRQQHLASGIGESHQTLPVIAGVRTACDVATSLETVDDARHGRRLHFFLGGQLTHQQVTRVEQHSHR
jgi:hypothetical protein